MTITPEEEKRLDAIYNTSSRTSDDRKFFTDTLEKRWKEDTGILGHLFRKMSWFFTPNHCAICGWGTNDMILHMAINHPKVFQHEMTKAILPSR